MEIGFLSRLPTADMADLRPNLKEIRMHQGNVLHSAGRSIDYVYFPQSGMISMLVVMKSGQQVETGIIGKDGVAGGSIASLGTLSFGQATVQIAGTALQISSKDFRAFFDKSAAFRACVNGFQAVMLFQAQQSAACHAVHSIESRLARWLLQSQDVLESDVINLTQEFLSNMMGVQRNTVSLSAHALQQAGLIDYSRGHIKILDRGGLMSCACECYDAIRSFIDHVMLNKTVTAGSEVVRAQRG